MNLEKRLLERSYSEGEVRKQILKVFWRDSQVDRESNREEQSEITLILLFIQFSKMLKNFLQNYIFCLSMTWPINKRIGPFTNVPIMGFENNRSLKKHIFWLCYPRLMWKADPKRAGVRNFLLRYVNQ